jgi:ribonuclease P protein component
MALPSAARLRTPAQFQAAARGTGVRRHAQGWLAMTVRPVQGETTTRVGITVAKRFARRAVDRACVKRVLREAARAALPALSCERCMHIVLRLNAVLPDVATLPRARFKRALRRDADALLARLRSTAH